MCGRFNLTASGEALAEAFELDEAPEVVPRYNIAPTQPVLVVSARGARGWRSARLGRPLPGEGRRRPPLLINARAETLGAQPALREAFAERRCLVPADGFYEWHARATRASPGRSAGRRAAVRVRRALAARAVPTAGAPSRS